METKHTKVFRVEQYYEKYHVFIERYRIMKKSIYGLSDSQRRTASSNLTELKTSFYSDPAPNTGDNVLTRISFFSIQTTPKIYNGSTD